MTNPVEPIHVSVQEGYSLWAANYDDGNALIELEEWQVEGLLPQVDGHQVLDAGAGTGRYSLRFARSGARVTALDSNRDMLNVARQKASLEQLDIEFKVGSLDNVLPVDSNQYDLAVCALTLCHVRDISAPVREFRRALKVGGILLITDFHPDTVAAGVQTQMSRDGVSYQLPNEPHTRADYLNAAEDAGLELIAVRDLATREATKERFSERYWYTYGDTNFCLIMLARKR